MHISFRPYLEVDQITIFADGLIETVRSNSTQSGWASTFDAVSGNGGFQNSSQTSNSSTATIQPTSQLTSWVADGTPTAGAFGSSNDIEQLSSGTYQGPTNSVLDLYELEPHSGTSTPAQLVGDFSLSSSGVLTFNPVPEPSTGAILALGLAALGMRRQRRAIVAA